MRYPGVSRVSVSPDEVYARHDVFARFTRLGLLISKMIDRINKSQFQNEIAYRQDR